MTAKVLIVEDNQSVREPLAALLRLMGITVMEAGDGEEALAELRRGPIPNLILLDLMMPGMDGWTFLDFKVHDSRLAPIPVLVISAVSKIKPPTSRADIVGIVNKPFELKALMKRVETFCGRTISVAG